MVKEEEEILHLVPSSNLPAAVVGEVVEVMALPSLLTLSVVDLLVKEMELLVG